MYIKDLKLELEEFLKAVHKLLSYCLAQRILILQITLIITKYINRSKQKIMSTIESQEA
jgi:hypothetical protein